VFVSLCGGVMVLASFDPPCSHPSGERHADAALVLSGDVDYLRLARAVRLVREGEVGWLMLTGAGVGGDSAEAMRELAVSRGVPARRIVVEPRATTTRENFVLSAPLLRERGFRTVALVTSASHMGRAERVARKAIPEVRWIATPVPDAGPRLRIHRTRLQEWAKLAWYAVRGWI
jgi:uncharacterized SAM-binding protein YcdF (DUF218 family)